MFCIYLWNLLRHVCVNDRPESIRGFIKLINIFLIDHSYWILQCSCQIVYERYIRQCLEQRALRCSISDQLFVLPSPSIQAQNFLPSGTPPTYFSNPSAVTKACTLGSKTRRFTGSKTLLNPRQLTPSGISSSNLPAAVLQQRKVLVHYVLVSGNHFGRSIALGPVSGTDNDVPWCCVLALPRRNLSSWLVWNSARPPGSHLCR